VCGNHGDCVVCMWPISKCGPGSDLAYEGEDAKAGHLDEGDRPSAHPSGKLGGVACLGWLSQEGGEATDDAAAQHDGTA